MFGEVRVNSSVVISCLEFSYNPSQRRVPAGSKGGGRWTKEGGVEHNTGHDLWIMSGISYDTTAAAARITEAEGQWDDHDSDPWAEDIARSMLAHIQGQKVRTTTYYSGHGAGWGHLKEGDTVDVPLMAITPSRGLAEIYAGSEAPGKRTAEVRRKEAQDQAQKVLDGLEPDKRAEISPEAELALRGAFMEINARNQGLRQAFRHNPVTVFKFESNKSTPIRSNERVASGRYVVTGTKRVPDREVLWDSEKKDFVDSFSQEVTLKFVDDLPIVA